MYSSKLTKCFTSIVIFQYHLVRWCKLKIHITGRPSGVHAGYQQESLQRELDMTYIDFTILNSHVTIIYLRFIKSINFYVVRQKNLEQLYFSLLSILAYKMCLFSRKKNFSKIKWLVRKFYISKSVKRILAWPIFLWS